MVHIQAQKSKRHALFSENEREYLRDNIFISRVRKSQFHHDLEHRFDELLKDLELLRNAKKLKTWRTLRTPKYHHYFLNSNNFANIFSEWKKAYPDVLHRIKKKKKILYWLERKRYDVRIDDRLFNSNFLFRRIRIKLNEDDKTSFILAYERQNVLPLKKEDAITLEEIRKRLSGDSKVKTNITEIKKITKKTFNDPRNFEIHKIINKHANRNFKSLNKKLARYDSKLIEYSIQPYIHAESEK